MSSLLSIDQVSSENKAVEMCKVFRRRRTTCFDNDITSCKITTKMYIETILFVLEKNNNTCIKLPVSKDGDMSGSFSSILYSFE